MRSARSPTMASPLGLAASTAPNGLRVDRAFRLLVPPALRFRRPELAAPAIFTDKLAVLIPQLGAVGVVRCVLRHVGWDRPFRHLGHHIVVQLFGAKAGARTA